MQAISVVGTGFDRISRQQVGGKGSGHYVLWGLRGVEQTQLGEVFSDVVGVFGARGTDKTFPTQTAAQDWVLTNPEAAAAGIGQAALAPTASNPLARLQAAMLAVEVAKAELQAAHDAFKAGQAARRAEAEAKAAAEDAAEAEAEAALAV